MSPLMKWSGVLLTALIALTGLNMQTSAHHSFAMFDRTRPTMLVGTVREFQWTNPHAWIQLNAEAAAGMPAQEWSIELGSPNMLARSGWKSSLLQPGQRVAMIVNPLRDGSPGASLVSITLADGTVLGPGGAPPPTTGNAPPPR